MSVCVADWPESLTRWSTRHATSQVWVAESMSLKPSALMSSGTLLSPTKCVNHALFSTRGVQRLTNRSRLSAVAAALSGADAQEAGGVSGLLALSAAAGPANVNPHAVSVEIRTSDTRDRRFMVPPYAHCRKI
jgi:hypothetical protein